MQHINYLDLPYEEKMNSLLYQLIERDYGEVKVNEVHYRTQTDNEGNVYMLVPADANVKEQVQKSVDGCVLKVVNYRQIRENLIAGERDVSFL